MKKTLTFICFVFAISCAFGQSPVASLEYPKNSQEINNQSMVAYKQKNYKEGLRLTEMRRHLYKSLPKEKQKLYKDESINFYFNLACFNSLLGHLDEAVNSLDTAVQQGYLEYAELKAETDLESLHNNSRFQALLQQVREKGDYGYILQKSGQYHTADKRPLPVFSYQDADAPELASFRKTYNLDSVSGNGDEISKFKNLLFWVHNQVKHDGGSDNPQQKNAVDLIKICKKENRGVNCRMMATILRDVYQAEGFKTRVVSCMPKDTADVDCHVITVVWSATLDKWVWMDPTFNAYVSDEKGNLLNIEEVRNKLLKNETLVLNADANWNNKVKQTKAQYLDYYMSKNLYWLSCGVKNEWNIESPNTNKGTVEYINLYPSNFNTLGKDKKNSKDRLWYATNNDKYFWQKPASSTGKNAL